MLEAGEARVRTYSDNRAMARPMLAAEAQARRAARGLWAEPAYRVRLAGEAAPGFQLVEARVTGAIPVGEDVGLTFSGGRMTGLVPARALHDFDSAGAAPAGLVGRLVRVRGFLRSDLRMRLDHPEAIERLTEPD